MSIQDIKSLQAERVEKVSKMEELAKRQLTPEEQQAFDDLAANVAAIDERVSTLEGELAMASAQAAQTEANSSKLEYIKRNTKKSFPINA